MPIEIVQSNPTLEWRDQLNTFCLDAVPESIQEQLSSLMFSALWFSSALFSSTDEPMNNRYRASSQEWLTALCWNSNRFVVADVLQSAGRHELRIISSRTVFHLHSFLFLLYVLYLRNTDTTLPTSFLNFSVLSRTLSLRRINVRAISLTVVDLFALFV